MTNAKQRRYFIPAAPGFWILELCGGLAEGDYEATRVPVIAWELRPIDEDKPQGDCFAVPVTPEWGYDRIESAVLGPDGRVRIAGKSTCASRRFARRRSAKARGDRLFLCAGAGPLAAQLGAILADCGPAE